MAVMWQHSICILSLLKRSWNLLKIYFLSLCAQRKTGCSCPVRSRYVEAGIVFKWICPKRENVRLHCWGLNITFIFYILVHNFNTSHLPNSVCQCLDNLLVWSCNNALSINFNYAVSNADSSSFCNTPPH